MAIKLLTPEEVAELTATNVRLIIRLSQEGKIRGALKFGGRWKYDKEIFERWLKSKAQQTSLKILIIDDEPEILTILSSVVKEMGHESIIAAGGQEALDILKTSRDFSLIILDLVMPGVDGVDVLKWLSDHGENVAILIYTGHVDSTICEKALEYSFVTVLGKPANTDQLRSAIDFCIKGVFKESA